MHARELEAAKASDAAKSGYFVADWDHPMPMKTIDGQLDLFGDGKVVLVPLHGHTPGTIGALIRLDRDGKFLLASDALSIRTNLDRNIVPKNTHNPEQFLKSFEEIRRIEKDGATIICSHDESQWETLRKGMDAYD